MNTVLGVIIGGVLIVVITGAGTAAGQALSNREWRAAAASLVIAFGTLGAAFLSLRALSPPTVERTLTTAAEECRCERRQP